MPSSDLGAQSAILGGGRYDKLIADLGGPSTSGVGFAIGEDRLIEILPDSFRTKASQGISVFILARDAAVRETAAGVADLLRDSGIRTVLQVEPRSMSAAMKYADRIGSTHTVIIGDEEMKEGKVTLKEMKSGHQKRVTRERVVEILSG